MSVAVAAGDTEVGVVLLAVEYILVEELVVLDTDSAAVAAAEADAAAPEAVWVDVPDTAVVVDDTLVAVIDDTYVAVLVVAGDKPVVGATVAVADDKHDAVVAGVLDTMEVVVN